MSISAISRRVDRSGAMQHRDIATLRIGRAFGGRARIFTGSAALRNSMIN